MGPAIEMPAWVMLRLIRSHVIFPSRQCQTIKGRRIRRRRVRIQIGVWATHQKCAFGFIPPMLVLNEAPQPGQWIQQEGSKCECSFPRLGARPGLRNAFQTSTLPSVQRASVHIGLPIVYQSGWAVRGVRIRYRRRPPW